MADFPAMPFWTDAYLADTGHLSDAEHGRYIIMLIQLWRSPRQRFPNDDQWLARKFRRSVDEVKTELRPLIEELMQCDGNWITQKRLSREFSYVSARSEKQSARAKLRWKKEKGLCRGNAGRHASGNAPTPTPTPTPKEEKDIPIGISKKTTPRGSRLSDHVPSNGRVPPIPESFLLEAEKLGCGVGEWAAFWDYWVAKPGQGGVKLDWLATWRNWCRRAVEFRSGGNGGMGRAPPPARKPRSKVAEVYEFRRMLHEKDYRGPAE